jgi:hypothetical protein
MKYITVKQFKEILEKENDDDIIVLSRDSEGNEFSPLDGSYGVNNYLPEEGCNYGEIHIRKLTDKLRKQGYDEEDLGDEEDRKRMIKCITLYPLL